MPSIDRRTAAAAVKWSFLFLLPLIVRSWVWIVGSGMGFRDFDTSEYLGMGKTYVQGILSGNLTSFSEGAWHPPLAKILIGLAQLPFSDPNASSEAAVLLLCILSASIGVITYSLGSSIGGNAAGWVVWALVSFDPGMVAWTTAWLDTPMVLFTLLALRYLYRNGGKRSSVLSGLFIALALLCKYSAAPYFLLVLILTKKPDFRLALTVLTCSLIVALNPQFWILQGRLAMSSAVSSGWGFLPYTLESALYAGPLAYPWAFLTAMGRFPAYSVFAWGGDTLTRQLLVVPSAAPLVVLGLFLLPIFLHSRRGLTRQMCQVPFVWLGSAVLTLALLPKSLPYYEVMLVPQAALCAAALLGWYRSRHSRLYLESPRRFSVPRSALVLIGCIYVVLSPYAVLFRLIRGSSNPWVLVLQALTLSLIQKGVMPLESLVAFLFTTGLAICSVVVAIRFLGFISGSKGSSGSTGIPVPAACFSRAARRFRSSSTEVSQDFLNTTLKQGIENGSRRLRMPTQTGRCAEINRPTDTQAAGPARVRSIALCHCS